MDHMTGKSQHHELAPESRNPVLLLLVIASQSAFLFPSSTISTILSSSFFFSFAFAAKRSPSRTWLSSASIFTASSLSYTKTSPSTAMAPTGTQKVERSKKMHSKVVCISPLWLSKALCSSTSCSRSSSARDLLVTRPQSILPELTSHPSCSRVSWPTALLLVASSPPLPMVRPPAHPSRLFVLIIS